MQGVKSVTDEEILAAMRDRSGPAFATAECAEWFDMSRQGIHNRLQALHDRGAVKKKQPSKRVVLWWLPDAETECCYPDPSESPDNVSK